MVFIDALSSLLKYAAQWRQEPALGRSSQGIEALPHHICMFTALRREGVAPARARRLAALVIASTEGTVAMCRAARSAQPLDDVGQELELVLSSALPK